MASCFRHFAELSISEAPYRSTLWQVRRLADAEGLRLTPSSSASGFKGVTFKNSKHKARIGKRDFLAHSWRLGTGVYLGTFFTAEEAALAVARHEA